MVKGRNDSRAAYKARKAMDNKAFHSNMPRGKHKRRQYYRDQKGRFASLPGGGLEYSLGLGGVGLGYTHKVPIMKNYDLTIGGNIRLGRTNRYGFESKRDEFVAKKVDGIRNNTARALAATVLQREPLQVGKHKIKPPRKRKRAKLQGSSVELSSRAIAAGGATPAARAAASRRKSGGPYRTVKPKRKYKGKPRTKAIAQADKKKVRK